ncbi:MAG: UDP-glucose 4-epimerase GalE [Bacilli bacterium]|nr:UDP-glucose 4-epimerase GalE [Bacilli bacterium]
MKVLIAGGAGYIGSHCVKMMAELGIDVVVVDNLSTGHKEAVNEKLYIGDIRNQAFLDEVFQKEKIDAVLHFCAKSLVGVSMQEPLEYFNNNVYGTMVLLESMARANVNKIVFSSSAAVYGEHEKMPITEDYPLKPTSPYGESKLMMEQMIKWADIAHGFKYVSLRYFNVAGAYHDASIGEDHNPETHLIPIVLQAALGNRDYVSVFGNDYPTRDGTCIRDYIHVVDLIDAHIKALNYLNMASESEIFNLGSQDGYSVYDIIETARLVTGIDIKQEIGPRRAGDPAKLIASSQKIERILGWSPQYGIKEIIEDAWRFHKTHPRGYKQNS